MAFVPALDSLVPLGTPPIRGFEYTPNPPKARYLRAFFFAAFFGCGGDAHSFFSASLNGIGADSFSGLGGFVMDANTDKREFKSFEALCAAIGFTALTWALTERALDGCVSAIYDGLRMRLPHGIPKSFSRKHEFLIKHIKLIPYLAPIKSEGMDILAEAKRLAETRNDLIHGVVEHVHEIDGGFNFNKLDYGKHDHFVREFRHTADDWQRLLGEFVDLQTKTVRFSGQLIERVGRNQK